MARYPFICILILTASCESTVENQGIKIVPPEIDPTCISMTREPRGPGDSLLVGKTRLTNGCQGIVEVTGAWHKNGALFKDGTTGTMRLNRGESAVVRVLGDGPGTYEFNIYRVVLAESNGVACGQPGGDLGHSLPGRAHPVLLIPSLASGDAQRVCTSVPNKKLVAANCYSLNIAQTDQEQRSGWKCESDVVCGDGVIISKIETLNDPTGMQVCALVKNGSSRAKKIMINPRFQ